MKRNVIKSPAVITAILLISLSFVFIVGCEKKEEGAIKLGATFPLTGEVASYGQKAKRGIEMAVAEVNTNGGLLGRQVEVDFQDDRNDKKEAVNIVTKLATIDKVPIIFGSAGSSVTLSIAPVVNQNKVILISPISSSAKLSSEGGSFFFRTCPADDLQSKILADWVISTGAKNVVVVYTNNSWGKPLSEGFESKFTAQGGTVLLKEGVAENANDFRTIITKLKSLQNIDAIVSPTYPKEGGTFVKQLKELGLEKPLFGGDNWGSPEFINIAGQAAEGVFYTAPSESQSPTYTDFATKYEAKYGEVPDVFGAYAYDAASAVFKAIEAAQGLETDKIRQALHNVVFQGVSGKIVFTKNGDLQSEAFDKKTIKNGKGIVL